MNLQIEDAFAKLFAVEQMPSAVVFNPHKRLRFTHCTTVRMARSREMCKGSPISWTKFWAGMLDSRWYLGKNYPPSLCVILRRKLSFDASAPVLSQVSIAG